MRGARVYLVVGGERVMMLDGTMLADEILPPREPLPLHEIKFKGEKE